jgi:hypothetical protein
VADQLFWMRVHGHPIQNGAAVGSPEDALRVSMQSEESPYTAPILALLGYRWATWDTGLGRFVGKTMEQVLAYGPPEGFRVVQRTPNGSLLMRITAPPAAGVALRLRGFSLEGGRPEALWLDGTSATVLVCATRAGRQTLVTDGAAFAGPRTLRFGNARPVTFPASGAVVTRRVSLDLRPGWQVVTVDLVGSQPTRPSDLSPYLTDNRQLSVSLGAIRVAGTAGDPTLCRSGLREALEPR